MHTTKAFWRLTMQAQSARDQVTKPQAAQANKEAIIKTQWFPFHTTTAFLGCSTLRLSTPLVPLHLISISLSSSRAIVVVRIREAGQNINLPAPTFHPSINLTLIQSGRIRKQKE
jgi:hypothetical protein